MKKTKIFYWIFTTLFCLMMLGSSIPDLIAPKMAIEGFKQIFMPAYLIPFLSIAKILGVIAILVPGYPRLKEWAYAGLTFDLLGATYSILAAGMPLPNWIFMIIPLGIAFGAYTFYLKKLRATSRADYDSISDLSNTGRSIA
jgi:hypothetical protein